MIKRHSAGTLPWERESAAAWPVKGRGTGKPTPGPMRRVLWVAFFVVLYALLSRTCAGCAHTTDPYWLTRIESECAWVEVKQIDDSLFIGRALCDMPPKEYLFQRVDGEWVCVALPLNLGDRL